MTTSRIDESSLLQDYYTDANRQLAELRVHVPSAPDDQAALKRSIFCFRSIKAGAGFLDLAAIGSLASWGEDLLIFTSDSSLPWNAEITELLQALIGKLDQAIVQRRDVDAEAMTMMRQRYDAIAAQIPSDRRHGLTTSILRHANSSPVFTDQHSQANHQRFGDYLVEAGLVTADQLLEALIEQERGQESHLAILRSTTGLDANLTLELANQASETGRDLFSLADERGMLGPRDKESISDAVRRSRPPLGQVLVRLGISDRREVKNWLLSFYDRCRQSQSTTRRRVVDGDHNGHNGHNGHRIQSKSNVPITDVMDAAATEPMEPADGTVQGQDTDKNDLVPLPLPTDLADEKDLLDDYLTYFDNEAQGKLETDFIGMRELSSEELPEYLTSIYRQLHSLKGSCGFIGAVVSQRIVHCMEESIGIIQRNPDAVGLDELDDLTDFLLTSLDFLWELRAAIKDSRDEQVTLDALGSELQFHLNRFGAFIALLNQRIVSQESDQDVEDLF